jgi:carboxylate-amine ligase
MSTCGGSTGCWCVSSWSAARTCTSIWTIAIWLWPSHAGQRPGCRPCWHYRRARRSGWAPTPGTLGTDTGYASYRTLIWRRWPTAGALPGFESAADYDQAVADLIRSGVITDPGMIYFDIRPSAHLPTLELRISDSCTRLEDVVLLAGLFRALVIWAAAAECEGRPLAPVRPALLDAATWRAAQSGLQGDLVDPVTATAVPARRLIGQLLAELRPTLEVAGDWELVTGLTKSALARGCSAARQRAAYARGGLCNVVDTLAAETRATPPWLQDTGPARPAVSAA